MNSSPWRNSAMRQGRAPKRDVHGEMEKTVNSMLRLENLKNCVGHENPRVKEEWKAKIPSRFFLKFLFLDTKSYQNPESFADLDSWDNSLSLGPRSWILEKFLKNRRWWKIIKNLLQSKESSRNFKKILDGSNFSLLKFSLSRGFSPSGSRVNAWRINWASFACSHPI